MRTVILSIAVAVALSAAPQQSGNDRAAAQTDPNQTLLNRYCVTCHNQRLKTAKLELDQLDLAHPEKDAVIWERAIRKLRGGTMPPPGAPRPPDTAAATLATYLEDSLDHASKTNPNPGSVRIHRLNRAEYANAVRDIFGIEVDPAAMLPSDDISDGFDNIARALKVSPSFLDQYILAARAVARESVGAPQSTRPQKVTLRGIDSTVPLPPGSKDGVTGKYLFPYEADYELRVTDNPTVFMVDGQPVDLKGRTHLKAGIHSLVAAIASRSLIESEGSLFGFVPGAAGTGYSGNGIVVGTFIPVGGAIGLPPPPPQMTIDGPYNAVGQPAESTSRARIFVCRPPDPREENACASRILSRIAEKAYRRPVTSDDLNPIMRFYSEGRRTGTFEGGIENALVAILSSTNFLYRAERPPSGSKPGSLYRLGNLHLASRLSFFLWSTIPDDELLNVANQGKLNDPKILAQQVRRMLADPRASTLTTNFAFEWLKIRDMASIEPDPVVYPAFDAPLRAAMRKEMEMFIGSIFGEDRSVVDLLNANYTFVNERLAAHYGIENVRGDDFRRVTLKDPNRYGLLGKGAVLMVTAYPNRTSPVLRGSYILEKIAGTPPAPPPPNVPSFKDNKEGEEPKTVRQLMEAHRANPSCNACHGVMDPLGFSLENFDTIGTFRNMDRYTRTKIDTSGKLVDGTLVNGPSDLRNSLLRRREQFVQTFTEKLMTYALGRTLEYFDMPNIRKLVKDAKADDYKFSSIVMGVVTSPEFQMSTVEMETSSQSASPKQVAMR